MRKVLVTGGAGFLGINLIRFLLARGYGVVSLDIIPFDYREKSKIEIIKGDVRDKKVLETAMKDVEIVVHCAAALPLYSKEDIFSTEVDGTRNVLENTLRVGVGRVVYISSTAVYGIPDHCPLCEEDSLSGVGPYGEAKILAEKVCEEYRKKGLCVSILRPQPIVGPERLGVFALLFDWAKDGKNFPVLGSGNNRHQLLDVYDFCQVIFLAATLPCGRVNTVFNVGAEEFGTMREDYQAVLDHAGFGKRIVSFPVTMAIFILRILEFFKLSPLYKWVYEVASKDSFVSIDRAKKLLGWRPKYSNKEALIGNYEWYLAHHREFEGDIGISHRSPWKQGLLAVVKLFF
ncbi:NAD-dependent epimerase/dehydratase family protein [Patescibacteria group bacterium]|nr:MAG: NAD-dependent epimerase/dehydratase family protein [Patescibacteria group bacterium]